MTVNDYCCLSIPYVKLDNEGPYRNFLRYDRQTGTIISKAHTASFFRIDVCNRNYHILQITAAWFVKLCHSARVCRKSEEPAGEPFSSGPNTVTCTTLVEAHTELTDRQTSWRSRFHFEVDITSHHFTSPHITSLHITSSHITSPHITSPHFTSHHITSPHHFTSPHITSHHFTSPITSHSITSHHFTSPHFTSLHLTSLHFTSHHIASLHLTPNHFT